MPPTRAVRGFVVFLFFVSGTAALIYEVSWLRQIGLFFGHTAQAAAIVLGSFFAGMSIGYLVGGRIANRVRPLVGFATAELLAACWAVLLPSILSGTAGSRGAEWLSYDWPLIQTASRAFFCFFLLLPATAAMGATLPFVAQFCADQRRLSFAYAANTLGAMCGVGLASGYLLLNVGVVASSYFAAGLSAASSVLAFAVAKMSADASNSDPSAATSDTQEGVVASVAQRPWLAVAVVSGFCTLALEVLYTRMFALVFHNSIYTFAIVVTVFLLALAAGAAMFSLLVRKLQASTLAIIGSLGGAIGITAGVLIFVRLTELRYFSAGETILQFLSAACGLVLLVVFPPVFLFGMVLPSAWTASREAGPHSGRHVAQLAAANAAAAALGSIAASFLLMPLLGLWMSFMALAVVACLLAVGIAWLGISENVKTSAKRGIVAVVAFVTVAAAMLLALAPQMIQSDPAGDRSVRLIQRWEGAYGWIEVVERDSPTGHRERAVRQNVHYTHGSTGDAALREYRQAHLPLLLHPQPKSVLFLGLGTGMTAGASLLHGETEQIAIAELVPEVIDAAEMLADANYGVVEHPNVQIFADDARHYLQAHRADYDVIVSDLFVPWESRTGYLYTVEHYRLGYQRLRPGGLYCQWLALYQVSRREFELIADSFASVFPYTTVWWGNQSAGYGIVGLVGSDRPIKLDLEAVAQRMDTLRVAGKQTDPRMYPVKRIPLLYIGRWEVRNAGWLNTDEWPRVEFLAPIAHKDVRQPRLRYQALGDYYVDVFERLDTTGLNVVAIDGAVEDMETPNWNRARHNWHRESLGIRQLE